MAYAAVCHPLLETSAQPWVKTHLLALLELNSSKASFSI
jgi:hypothetical protein